MIIRCTYARAVLRPRMHWFVGILFCIVSSQLFAQVDDVHLTPRKLSDSTANSAEFHPRSTAYRVDVDLVLVPATVTDAQNHPVTGLKKHNFSLAEDGQLQQIRYFHEEDAPISVGILLDTSGSMKKKYELACQALNQFFANANRDDDYFVITFSEKPHVLADTTQSIESIEAELSAVVPHGGTPLLDAIYLGLSKLRHARYEKRALLIISDGGDNQSRYSSREIREIAQESDVLIYSLGIFPFSLAIEDWTGKKLLSDISEASGGRAVFLNSPEKLPAISANMSRELRSQYVLGYRPPEGKRVGRLRRIAVKLNPASNVAPFQVYYRRQYLAAK
jgi:Ca-activated chloride channel family protein